jgi:hypothetical protein
MRGCNTALLLPLLCAHAAFETASAFAFRPAVGRLSGCGGVSRTLVRSSKRANGCLQDFRLPRMLPEVVDVDFPIQDRHEGRGWGLAKAAAVAGTVTLLAAQPAFAVVSEAAPGASLLSTLMAGRFDSIASSGFFQAFSLVFVSEIGDKVHITLLFMINSSFCIAELISPQPSFFLLDFFHCRPSGSQDKQANLLYW